MNYIIPTRHWDDLRVPTNEQRIAEYEAKRNTIGRDVRPRVDDSPMPDNPHRWQTVE